jgi:4-alpha-glucanotransferase
VDFLGRAGQRWWQTLPVGPVGYGNSPYSALSAFAGSALLIDLDDLVGLGLLSPRDLAEVRLPRDRVNYAATRVFRERHLRAAHRQLGRKRRLRAAIAAFAEENRAWLDDFCLYRALKRAHDERAWIEWEPEVRDRRPAALERARGALAEDLDFVAFEQWLFDRQWRALREHTRSRGVGLIGDVPIFVAHDSSDVWAHRDLFHLDAEGNPTVIAGVPPDYFSRTGQRWGNPLYRWPKLRRSGYAWWIARFRQTLHRFDAVRLDHFIGFTRAWEIPADEPTALNGRWVPGPGAHFFRAVGRAVGGLPLIAEDLGAVTPEVTALRDQFGMPGIRILQFAFGNDPQAPTFKPHHYPRHAVVYTGTHDNDTAMGWFREPGGPASTRSPEQVEVEREFALRYLGSDGKAFHRDMIRALYASVADLAMVPLQDVLGLGNEARMNLPGTVQGNWEWRFRESVLTDELAEWLALLGRTYDRLPPSPAVRPRARGRAAQDRPR